MRNAFLADQLLINRSETSFEPIEANLCIDMHIGYYKYVRLCASMLSETESRCRERREEMLHESIRFTPKIVKRCLKKVITSWTHPRTVGYGTLAASVAINECIIHYNA